MLETLLIALKDAIAAMLPKLLALFKLLIAKIISWAGGLVA